MRNARSVMSSRLPIGVATRYSMPDTSLPGAQIDPDDLLVIARHDVPVGIRGVRPVHRAQLPPVAWIRGRFDQRRTADLLVPLRRKRRDNQVAAIVVYEKAIAVPHHVARGPARLLSGDLLGLPHALARARVQAAQLAVAADAVDIIADNRGRRNQRVQTVGVDLA